MELRKGVDYTGVTVVFACHDGKGNYLHSLRGSNCRDEQGTWDPGGGGLDTHDSVEETLRKEIREEYCTEVLEYEFLGYRDVHRNHDGKKTHWIALDFRVLVDPSTVRNGEPHKMEEIAWFRLDELPENLHSQYPYFLEKDKDRLT